QRGKSLIGVDDMLRLRPQDGDRKILEQAVGAHLRSAQASTPPRNTRRASPTRKVTFSRSKCSPRGMTHLREAPTRSFHSSVLISPRSSRYRISFSRRAATALAST